MEFIKVEQFKEQPIEVQKVFLDWWKPSVGDLFTWIYQDKHDMSELGCCCSELQAEITDKNKNLDNRIPLFTEGQLRKFIEDKTECKTDTTFYIYDGYDIEITKPHYIDGYCLTQRTFEDLGKDLLQAYWKVACTIAKEFIE